MKTTLWNGGTRCNDLCQQATKDHSTPLETSLDSCWSSGASNTVWSCLLCLVSVFTLFAIQSHVTCFDFLACSSIFGGVLDTTRNDKHIREDSHVSAGSNGVVESS